MSSAHRFCYYLSSFLLFNTTKTVATLLVYYIYIYFFNAKDLAILKLPRSEGNKKNNQNNIIIVFDHKSLQLENETISSTIRSLIVISLFDIGNQKSNRRQIFSFLISNILLIQVAIEKHFEVLLTAKQIPFFHNWAVLFSDRKSSKMKETKKLIEFPRNAGTKFKHLLLLFRSVMCVRASLIFQLFLQIKLSIFLNILWSKCLKPVIAE